MIVHVDCGDGSLTTALAAVEGTLVHGLGTDAARVKRIRERLIQGGQYGPVSVREWQGRYLPYIDNLVNLIVCEGPDLVPREELLRVLTPGGTVCIRGNGR